jgi:hypothetical protein
MFELDVSRTRWSPWMLITASCWGIMCIGGIWLDFAVRHAPLSLWREVWLFLVCPGLCVASIFTYQRQRSKEREAV